jgi:branched-chain amino acid transport system ATP-binding protein
MLAIESLSVEFGGLKALESIDFSAKDGEIVGIVGPNGAGKTTLFDAIGGVVAPTAGSITFDGVRIDGMPMHARASRGIARTHQTPRLFLRMSPLENVAAGTYLQRAPKSLVDDAVREALSISGYAGALAIFARDVSENDRRRIELARALAASPRLFLLDEPLASFDEGQREVLRARLAACARERKATMLIAERDIAECAVLCDRVVVLHAGKMIAQGTPKDVAADPDVRDAYFGVEWRQ